MTDTTQGNLPGDLVLQPSPDSSKLFASCNVRAGEDEQVIFALQEELVRVGLGDLTATEQATGRLRAALDAVRTTLPPNAKALVKNLVLLEGTPPQEAIDSWMEWTANFFDDSFVVDPETGVIDYRQRAGQLSVEEGQLIGTMHPSIEGKPGRDVFGKPIYPNKPKQLLVRIGPNVRHDDDTNEFYAMCSGRLRYAGNMLAVDQVMVIDNVNLASGNIHHPGALVVTLNIESGATVETSGDIEVRGYVENAVIRSGGSLLVRGGITGGGSIRVSGDVQAKFIQSVAVESFGNVTVEREIDQCAIHTRGGITVTHGRIVGGEMVGHGGVVADQFGSDGGTRTIITAGVDFWLDERRRELEPEAAALTERITQICEKLEPFRRPGARIPDQAKDAVRQLVGQVQTMEARLKEIEEELEALRADSLARRKLDIIARRRVCADTFLHMNGLVLKTRDEVVGPVRVGVRDGDLCFVETRIKK